MLSLIITGSIKAFDMAQEQQATKYVCFQQKKKNTLSHVCAYVGHVLELQVKYWNTLFVAPFLDSTCPLLHLNGAACRHLLNKLELCGTADFSVHTVANSFHIPVILDERGAC